MHSAHQEQSSTAPSPTAWPPASLRLFAKDPHHHDQQIHLRVVDDRSIVELGIRNQAEDIFPDPTAPWVFGWVGAAPAEIISFSYASLASLTPKDERTPWELKLACFKGEDLIGTCSLRRIIRDEQVLYDTGSYLFCEFQGQGYGRLMRRMLLHLAFEGFGLKEVESAAQPLNRASVELSRSLGYHMAGHTDDAHECWVINAQAWAQHARDDDPQIIMTGVEGLAEQLHCPSAP